MARQAKPKDNTMLEMAIVGYQSEIDKINAKIAVIREQLGKRGAGRPKATPATAAGATLTVHPTPAKRRRLSKAGRLRIAAAQRARWAAYKKQQAIQAKAAAPAQPAKPKKRKISAAGLNAIREATKKRWAAFDKAKETAA
jgi:hypothetical protein